MTLLSFAFRRVILVDLCWTRDKDPRLPLGHASLLAALQKNPSIDVRSIVLPVNPSLTSAMTVVEKILSETGDLPADRVDVALGAYVWNEAIIQAVLPLLRSEGFRGRIVLGGPQISYTKAGLEALYPQVDVFIRGFAEEALVALESQEGKPLIAGVHFAGTLDRFEVAPTRLETLASPWLNGMISVENVPFLRWETQRGCPFRCSFCQHREPGMRLRRRNLLASRVMSEVDLFCRSNVGEIAVLDPVFNIGVWGTEVLERFASGCFSGRLSLQCRAEVLDSSFLDAAGALNTCLELGLQTIHPQEGEAVGRRNDMVKLDRAMGEIWRREIDHEVSLIFGLPLQTLDSFIESVRWCLERRIPRIRAFPLLLLRGTELEEERARWGLVTEGRDMPMVVSSATFTREEWRAMAEISEALRATENRHPARIEDLIDVAAALAPQMDRWQAPTGRNAA